MTALRVKDIEVGGVYAIRRPRIIAKDTGEEVANVLDPVWGSMFGDSAGFTIFDPAVHETTDDTVAGTVIKRVPRERVWKVRIGDDVESVPLNAFAGRWEDHESQQSAKRATEALAGALDDLGWLDSDRDGVPLMSGPRRNGRVSLELTAAQAQTVADALRAHLCARESLSQLEANVSALTHNKS